MGWLKNRIGAQTKKQEEWKARLLEIKEEAERVLNLPPVELARIGARLLVSPPPTGGYTALVDKNTEACGYILLAIYKKEKE